MNKISFPKNSLKFKKLTSKVAVDIEKSTAWKRKLSEYVTRKKYVDMIEREYPVIDEDGLRKIMPKEVFENLPYTKELLQESRKMFKNINSFPAKHNYEIKFKHPKWAPIIGEIVMSSEGKTIKNALSNILKEFKLRKDKYREFRVRTKTHKVESLKTNISYNVSGGVIYMPKIKEGVYVQFLKEQEKRIVFSNKTPKELLKNYIGVELEFICNTKQDELGNKLYDAGLGRFVTLKEDHSIKCNHGRYPVECPDHDVREYGHELCVIAKENEYLDILKKVCVVLAEVKAVVNKTCGMHVHIDMRNRDVEKAYQNFLSSQGILLKMNPKSRTEMYAKKNNQRDFEEARTRGGNRDGRVDQERYYGINAKSFTTHKTIEIRFHAGTVDFTKITNWIAILLNIANHNERIVKDFISVNSFCKEYDISEELKVYIEERAKKFAAQKGGVVIPEAETGAA